MTAEAAYLEAAGVLSRHFVKQGGGPLDTVNLRAQKLAFQELEAREPGMWSVGSGPGVSPFDADEIREGRGMLVRLYEAVPVPDKAVPLQDILEFRDRRRSELLAFRHHVDRIYQVVVASPDDQMALRTEVEALDRAICDYIKSSSGMISVLRSMTLEAKFNIPAAVTAYLGAASKHLTQTQTLLVVAAAGFTIGPTAALLKRSASPTPYRYVSQFHREVFSVR